MRLGAEAVSYEAAASQPALSVTPMLRFWTTKGARIAGLISLGLLAWCLYAIFTMPAFFVFGAEISGNDAVSAREIYIAADIDSQSIFWINPEEVAHRVTALPNIKSTSVSVLLPSQIAIDVIERQPQLLWQTDEDVWWVDEEGTVVPPKANVDNMMRIIDDDRQPLEVGYQIDPTIIKGAQTLRILAPDVSVIRHARAHGLIVATPEGWPVYLGNGSDMKAKLIVLSALLPDIRAEETPPLYIDIRDPLRPVYKILPVVQIAPPVPQVPAFPRSPLPPRPRPGRP